MNNLETLTNEQSRDNGKNGRIRHKTNHNTESLRSEQYRRQQKSGVDSGAPKGKLFLFRMRHLPCYKQL